MHKPHVTVAAVVQHQDKYLFVLEKDKTTNQRVINQPAGHLEQNETLIEACQRELLEETGLQLQPESFIGTYRYRAPNGIDYLRFCFYFQVDTLDHPLAPQDSDIEQALWLTKNELHHHTLRSPLVLQCLTDSEQRPRVSLEYICG